MKKKLTLNKRTIWNLDIKKTNVLGKDDQKVVNGGSDNTTEVKVKVGTSRHPKYC